jgi:hypothetical protein
VLGGYRNRGLLCVCVLECCVVYFIVCTRGRAGQGGRGEIEGRC